MTAAVLARPDEPLAVHIGLTVSEVRDEFASSLRKAGIALTREPDPAPGTVMVVGGDRLHEAIAHYGRTSRIRRPMLLVADTFTRGGMLHAVRAGVRVMIRAADVCCTPRVAAAVRAARHGECRMPHEALSRLLVGAPGSKRAVATAPPSAALTPRQTTVLKLIAEGLGNTAIATTLECSEHTVKNIIYDMMGRLQVRNRTHAVAHAVRTGLI